jgi:hypothetical protein
MMHFQDYLDYVEACFAARMWVGNRSLAECIEDIDHDDYESWSRWLVLRVDDDLYSNYQQTVVPVKDEWAVKSEEARRRWEIEKSEPGYIHDEATCQACEIDRKYPRLLKETARDWMRAHREQLEALMTEQYEAVYGAEA